MELALARAQELVLQERALLQALRVQQEPLVQAQPQVQLELEQRLQQSCPKLQLHRHRCKVPDRSRKPQQAHCQTQAHPKASDMTPLAMVQRELQGLQVLALVLVPEREQLQERAAQQAQELVRRAQQEPLELQVQEPEPAPELHVSLERLPLRQGSTQHI